jgi:hypothetical protein
MLATLCSYESRFGPYHPHTLQLMIAVGTKFANHGDAPRARLFLERAVADLSRVSDRHSESRRRALLILRELAERDGDKPRTRAIDTELLTCELLGVSAHA